MQVTASLNNLRMTPRKVRQVTNLVKGLNAKVARTQLQFMNKKAAGIVLKLLNSGLSNAKHNFSLDENNLYIEKLVVEAGPSLKRWLPRAMGRATPILKRTCSIILTLGERVATKPAGVSKKKQKVETAKPEAQKPAVEKEEIISAVVQDQELKARPVAPQKPYGASSQSKKRFFSRQTFKRVFRRKSI